MNTEKTLNNLVEHVAKYCNMSAEDIKGTELISASVLEKGLFRVDKNYNGTGMDHLHLKLPDFLYTTASKDLEESQAFLPIVSFLYDFISRKGDDVADLGRGIFVLDVDKLSDREKTLFQFVLTTFKFGLENLSESIYSKLF